MPTAAQIKAIHTLKSRARLGDEDYRGLLRQVAGVDSSRALSAGGAIAVIDRLKTLADPRATGKRTAAETVSGPYAGKLRALWLSAWNLGQVQSRDDTALIAFVTRQTGLSHTRWLVDGGDAAKAIEALKSICARAGVVWPRDRQNVIGAKQAVIAAQRGKLIAAGVQPVDPTGLGLDEEQSALGRQIRAMG